MRVPSISSGMRVPPLSLGMRIPPIKVPHMKVSPMGFFSRLSYILNLVTLPTPLDIYKIFQ
jgi:hypothetical protein